LKITWIFCEIFNRSVAFFLLKGLKADLESNKEKICSLRETADKLLMNTDSVDMTNVRDKMHIIANRQNALKKLCSSYVANMEDMLRVPKPSTADVGVQY
jgi:hypothetical protein